MCSGMNNLMLFFNLCLLHSFDFKDASLNYMFDVIVGNGASSNCFVK
jgi:hypothetical protein